MKNSNISIERRNYLKKFKKQRLMVLLTQVLIIVGFLAIWEFLANQNIIDSFITSKPSRIISTFMNLTSNDLLTHIGVTAYETVIRIFTWNIFRIFYSNFTLVVEFFFKSF